MRNILTEKRQWCKVEIGKKTEKYAQTASESLFEKRCIVYKITLHAAGAGGEGDCSFTKRQTDERWEEFPVGIAIRQEIFGLFFCRFFFHSPTVENMSVLPTNAAVFYVIFIDKDVDKF